MTTLRVVKQMPADPDKSLTARRTLEILRGDRPKIVLSGKADGYEIVSGVSDAIACRRMGLNPRVEVKGRPKKIVSRCRHCRGKGYLLPKRPQRGHLSDPAWKKTHEAGMALLLEDIERNLELLKPYLES